MSCCFGARHAGKVGRTSPRLESDSGMNRSERTDEGRETRCLSHTGVSGVPTPSASQWRSSTTWTRPQKQPATSNRQAAGHPATTSAASSRPRLRKPGTPACTPIRSRAPRTASFHSALSAHTSRTNESGPLPRQRDRAAQKLGAQQTRWRENAETHPHDGTEDPLGHLSHGVVMATLTHAPDSDQLRHAHSAEESTVGSGFTTVREDRVRIGGWLTFPTNTSLRHRDHPCLGDLWTKRKSARRRSPQIASPPPDAISALTRFAAFRAIRGFSNVGVNDSRPCRRGSSTPRIRWRVAPAPQNPSPGEPSRRRPGRRQPHFTLTMSGVTK